ncbi:MAG: hypothetical protein ACM3ZE_27600, partial [Myxococcales bacterium]
PSTSLRVQCAVDVSSRPMRRRRLFASNAPSTSLRVQCAVRFREAASSSISARQFRASRRNLEFREAADVRRPDPQKS